MTLNISISLITGYLFLLFRAAGFYALVPLPGLSNSPEFVRVALAFATAASCIGQINYPLRTMNLVTDFVVIAILETLWGSALGILVKSIEEFALLGGQQLGFAEHLRRWEVEILTRFVIDRAAAIDQDFVRPAAAAGNALLAVIGDAGHITHKSAGTSNSASKKR